MNVYRLSFFICIASCLGLSAVPNSLKAETSPLSDPIVPDTQTVAPSSQVRSIARAITVKVMAGNLWGSGIIVNRQNDVYTVLTNAHVARLGKSFQIKTSDGRVYTARLQKSNDGNDEDLAILTFASNSRYRVANLVISSYSNPNSLVFAAGFPAQGDRFSGENLVITQGKIATLLPQSMKGGYQLGYTNDIYKGMSGGALLNQSGEVIAVNGKHKHPLWGNTYIYQDGSSPDERSRKKMDDLSWGIPISSVSRRFPQLIRAVTSESQEIVPNSDRNFNTFESNSREVQTSNLSVDGTQCQGDSEKHSINGDSNRTNRQLQSQNRPRRAW
jgi:S1-C subfamily serine protease